MHVLVCGAAGYTNLGDDAILWGMAAELEAIRGKRPLMLVGGPLMPELAAGIGAEAISYDDREALARAIEDADLVIVGGGGLLYDVEFEPDLARLLTDRPDRRWLYETGKIVSASRAAGRPVMLYAVGVGPLATPSARKLTRYIAEQASAITVRDFRSAELLAECGLPATRVHLAADPALEVEPSSSGAARALLERSGLFPKPRPWIGLNLRPWELLTAVPSFFDRMGELITALRERLGATVVGLPLQRMNDDDEAVLRKAIEAAGGKDSVLLLDPPTAPPDLVAALSHLDLVVGMRLHSLVLAASAGVPFVALPYTQKVWDFVEEMDWAAHAHSPQELSPSAVVASCEALLGDRAARERLRERREALRHRAAVSAKLAGFLLERGRSQRMVAPSVTVAPPAPVDRLRVLMQIRPDFRSRPGGDVVQLEELLPYLEAEHVSAELTGEIEPDVSEYDLIHLINLDRPEESYQQCLNAIRQGKPVVLSTVHAGLTELLEWGDTDYWLLPEPGAGCPEPRKAPPQDPIELQRRALAHLERQALIDWATVCLPNARADAQYLHDVFGMDLSRTVVVPNAPKEECLHGSPDLFVEKYLLKDFVLCVGRVEKKKNQLGLIASMRGTGIPLVIVGRANPESYLELCRRYADGNTVFIPQLAEGELASAYAAAKVHALPSWIELPGLTTLEAAAAGCNVVSTDRGSPREYFGELAWYCDPRRPDSIREAVLAAYAAPRSDLLRDRVRERFSWRGAAQCTLQGYRLAFGIHQLQGASAIQAREVRALRQHAEFLARLAADRGYEARRMWEWGKTVELELKRLQEEFDRVTSRRLHRWCAAGARGGWGMLRALGLRGRE